MSKKPSITQRVLEQYREQYGCDYDEGLASIRSMTTFISTNASRIGSGTPADHPWPMTYQNFLYHYAKDRFPDEYGLFNRKAVPAPVLRVMEILWIVMKVWHPEYPWIEEDDEWDEEPEDTEVMKDDREDEWEP